MARGRFARTGGIDNKTVFVGGPGPSAQGREFGMIVIRIDRASVSGVLPVRAHLYGPIRPMRRETQEQTGLH
jgi:hypothetical protein